jgi:ATP-dependent DNA ligase
VRVFSRNGHDWSDRYPGIVRAAAGLRCKSAIIDGEAVVQDENGVSTPSIFCISTAKTFDRKRSLSAEPC